MFSSYEEACDWLFSQFPAYHNLGAQAYNPGLKNTEELLSFFGNPHEQLRFVHVAGTNGKGSVSSMITSVLVESGETVGCFTSPHILDFSERIRVNGIPVHQQFVLDFCNRVNAHIWNVQPSFFEITWVMALVYFQEQNCSVVVAEVGLGGRLDATNVITPLLSIITNISLDHTNILGNTRAMIAAEKGGIIKPGVPVILGENDPETRPVFEQLAAEKEARILEPDRDSTIPSDIIGYQIGNFQIVRTAINYLHSIGFNCGQQELIGGMFHLRENTGFFGRLEVLGKDPLIILDCAHNEAGLKALFFSLPKTNGTLHIVYGTSSDKDLSAIQTVLPTKAVYHFCEFSNPRSASLESLKSSFGNFSAIQQHFFSSVEAAFLSAQTIANKEDTIIICGSFFLAHDFFSFFSL